MCCVACGSGVFPFTEVWRTTHTLDKLQTDRELVIKTTLRELIIYLVFLIVICIGKGPVVSRQWRWLHVLCCLVTYGMASNITYYYTRAMKSEARLRHSCVDAYCFFLVQTCLWMLNSKKAVKIHLKAFPAWTISGRYIYQAKLHEGEGDVLNLKLVQKSWA
jgi:hypothetical protein